MGQLGGRTVSDTSFKFVTEANSRGASLDLNKKTETVRIEKPTKTYNPDTKRGDDCSSNLDRLMSNGKTLPKVSHRPFLKFQALPNSFSKTTVKSAAVQCKGDCIPAW